MLYFFDATRKVKFGSELSVNFLIKKNYICKVVFDNFIINDMLFFNDIISEKYVYNSYSLSYPENKNKEKILYSNDHTKMFYLDMYYSAFPRIINFRDCGLYLFHEEMGYYQIFGEKHIINSIDKDRYSDRYARQQLKKLNATGTTYFQWLYDTYQHL